MKFLRILKYFNIMLENLHHESVWSKYSTKCIFYKADYNKSFHERLLVFVSRKDKISAMRHSICMFPRFNEFFHTFFQMTIMRK